MQTVDDPAFVDLRRRVARFQRMHGYYIVDVVSIESLRNAGKTQEQILDAVFEHFDDQAWPPAADRPSGVYWEDHEVSASKARESAVQALIGGSQIGHTRDTIPSTTAHSLWSEFESFFQEQRRYYTGMGLGDSKYAYLHGAAIVDQHRGGILWVVEGD